LLVVDEGHHYHVGDAVKVYWAPDDQWYEGIVDKVCPQTLQVYYEVSDSYSSHKKNDESVQSISNLGHDNDSDSDDDQPLRHLL
jgi:hypothetical protein